MKSDVCKIENGTLDLGLILKESEKVAVYNKLNEKQTNQLRLICEELDGMLPNIINDFSGDFWIDFEEGVCKANAEITIADFSADAKSELIKVSKNNKNAFATGLVGKIRSIIEDLFLDSKTYKSYDMSMLFSSAIEYSVGLEESAYRWSLNKYRKAISEENAPEWDELEKSIIASLADDIIIGVKGKKASIVVVKKFN